MSLVYTPEDAGIFRGTIEVDSTAQAFQKHIDVNATSIEFSKFVIDNEGNNT